MAGALPTAAADVNALCLLCSPLRKTLFDENVVQRTIGRSQFNQQELFQLFHSSWTPTSKPYHVVLF